MRIKLAGLPWRAASPSRFVLAVPTTHPIHLWYDGKCWRLGDSQGPWPHAFPSREQAARMVADGVSAWRKEIMA